MDFACEYLKRCNRESKSNDEINKEVYTKLVELDTRLGTKASKQLYECLNNTTRLDIIKVGIFFLVKDLKYFRLSILNKLTNGMSIIKNLLACTWSDLTKNQSQMMKLIRKYMPSLLNWIKDLVEEHPISCMSVFRILLDPISLRFRAFLE